jgi:hypothetical protein
MISISVTCAMLAVACGTVLAPRAPSGLSQADVARFYGTQIIKDLDLIRDFADDGSKTTPPLVSGKTDAIVAKWHKALVTDIHAAPGGWKALTLTGLDQLKTLVPPNDYARFAPYVALARTLVKEAL